MTRLISDGRATALLLVFLAEVGALGFLVEALASGGVFAGVAGVSEALFLRFFDGAESFVSESISMG